MTDAQGYEDPRILDNERRAGDAYIVIFVSHSCGLAPQPSKIGIERMQLRRKGLRDEGLILDGISSSPAMIYSALQTMERNLGNRDKFHLWRTLWWWWHSTWLRRTQSIPNSTWGDLEVRGSLEPESYIPYTRISLESLHNTRWNKTIDYLLIVRFWLTN